ncbi:MAG: hypothetical protein JJT89_02440 [Nitriliruptoraceae bacterium]|nr:hypothetical protein [Nitriliruptoraceae bacterium]
MIPSSPLARELRRRCDDVLERHERGDLVGALEAATQLAEDAAAADLAEPVVRESLFTARFERALLLTELGELDAAAVAYEQAAETPSDLDDPDHRHELAMAGLNRGICLDAIGDHEGAIAAYDAMLARFRDADDPVTADQVVRVRVNRAAALLAVDRIGEALTAAETLIPTLDPADALEAEQLAMCVRLRAAALCASARQAEAVAALEEVDRCTAEDPAARTQVIAAHRDRAQVLLELDRPQDALTTLDEVLARFGGEQDEGVLLLLDEVRDLRRELAEH